MFFRISHHALQRKKQEKRLTHLLNKFDTLAGSNPHTLLSLLPTQDYWRFFIDGSRQESSRGIRKALIEKHGEALITNETFLSQTLNEYDANNKKRKVTFKKNGLQMTIHEFLAYELYLYQYEYPFILATRLNHGKATIRDVLLLDQAWLAFEINEPNYLSSIFEAFFTLTYSNQPLSVELIRETHAALGRKVKGTNYDGNPTRPGEFRTSPFIAFGLTKSNASIDGITEMLNRKNQAHHFVISVTNLDDKASFRIILNHDTLKEIRNEHIITEFARFDSEGWVDNNPVDPDHKPLDNAFMHIISRISEAISRREIAKVIHSIIDGSIEFPQLHFKCRVDYAYDVPHIKTQAYYQDALQQLINDYEGNLQIANTPLAKLRAIVIFAQQCEQLHPFDDMNCRLFNMVILNYLLAQNGFPFVVQADPNRFDLYSVNELIDDMISGMKKSFELLNKKAIYGIDSTQLFASLKNSETHKKTYYAEYLKAQELLSPLLKSTKHSLMIATVNQQQ